MYVINLRAVMANLALIEACLQLQLYFEMVSSQNYDQNKHIHTAPVPILRGALFKWISY